jgi:hypothetical protein
VVIRNGATSLHDDVRNKDISIRKRALIYETGSSVVDESGSRIDFLEHRDTDQSISACSRSGDAYET